MTAPKKLGIVLPHPSKYRLPTGLSANEPDNVVELPRTLPYLGQVAKKGIPIFPLLGNDAENPPDAKKPRLPGDWHQYASIDPSIVREWIRSFPNAWWAAVVPKDMVVLDVDRREALSELEAEVGSLPKTWTTKTARGVHHLFKSDRAAAIGNKSGALPTGIDVRGGGKGYIVVLSPHHQVSWDGAPAILPPAVEDLILGGAWARRNVADQLEDVPPPNRREDAKPISDPTGWASSCLQCSVETLQKMPPNSGRRDVANDAAFRLGSAVALGLIPRASVLEALARAWEARGGSKHPVKDVLQRALADGQTDGLIERLKARTNPPQETSLRSNSTPFIVRKLADIRAECVQWEWSEHVVKGSLNLFQGDPKIGKTTVAIAFLAARTRGTRMPGHIGEPLPPARVAILDCENDPGTVIRPGMEAHDADLDRVLLIEGNDRLISLEDDLAHLRQVLAAEQVDLLLIDGLMTFFGAKRNANSDTEVRAVLSPLRKLALDLGLTIIAIRHLRKSGGSAVTAGMGSVAFGAVARSIVTFGKLSDGRRAFAPTGNHVTSSDCMTFGIETHPDLGVGVATFGDVVSGTSADDLAAPKEMRPHGARDLAAGFLQEVLAAGPRSAKDVQEAAAQRGISETTLKRAKGELRVRSTRVGRRSEWSLPGPGDA